MPNIHPIAVHFAIALFTVSVFCDVAAYFVRDERLKTAAWVNLIIAEISVIIAVLTGFSAEGSIIMNSQAQKLFEVHEIISVISLAVISILFIWRVFNRGEPRRKIQRLYLVVALIALTLILTTGHYGGRMVYEQGAGVKPVMKQLIADQSKNISNKQAPADSSKLN